MAIAWIARAYADSVALAERAAGPPPIASHDILSFDPDATARLLPAVLRLLRPALLAALVLAVGPAAAAGRVPDGYRQVAHPVVPGVWRLAQPGFQVQPAGNVTLIEQAHGLVLVDAGGSPGAARRVVAEVRRLSRKPVTAVVITHWHGDHPQGLDEILKAWPKARTIATAATRAHLADPRTMNTPAVYDAEADAAFQRRTEGFAAYAARMAAAAPTAAEQTGWAAAQGLFAAYAEDMRGAVTLAPAEAFEDRLRLPDARAPVEVRFLGRGATDGDAVVWLPRQRVLVTGDLVVAPVPYGFGSYPGDWLSTLDRLSAFDFRVLLPGHGPPQHDRAYLGRLRAAIVEVRTRVAPLAAQGLPLGDVQARLDFGDQAQRFVGDDPWLRRWFAEYWVRPVVASAYKEARGEPIVQGLGGE